MCTVTRVHELVNYFHSIKKGFHRSLVCWELSSESRETKVAKKIVPVWEHRNPSTAAATDARLVNFSKRHKYMRSATELLVTNPSQTLSNSCLVSRKLLCFFCPTVAATDACLVNFSKGHKCIRAANYRTEFLVSCACVFLPTVIRLHKSCCGFSRPKDHSTFKQ